MPRLRVIVAGRHRCIVVEVVVTGGLAWKPRGGGAPRLKHQRRGLALGRRLQG